MKGLLIVGLLLISSTAYGQIIETEDEFTGQTNYQTSLFAIQSGDVLEAKGRLTYRDESEFLFSLFVYDREFQYQVNNTAHFLIDGERAQVPIVARDSDYDRDAFTFEFQVQLSMIVDKAFLELIASSETVRFKIGSSVFKFSPTAMINVQSILDETQEINK